VEAAGSGLVCHYDCSRKFRVSSKVLAYLLFSSIVGVLVVFGKFDVGESSCQMFRVNQKINPVNDVISLLLRQPAAFLLLCFALFLSKAKPHGYQFGKENQVNRLLRTIRYHRQLRLELDFPLFQTLISLYILPSDIHSCRERTSRYRKDPKLSLLPPSRTVNS
jgi:hypothetical protein